MAFKTITVSQQDIDDGFFDQSELGNTGHLFGYGMDTPTAVRLRDAVLGLAGISGGTNADADNEVRKFLKRQVRLWETRQALIAERATQDANPDATIDGQ